MKRLLSVLFSGMLLIGLLVGVAPSANAVGTHEITVGGKVTLNDDDSPFRDDHAEYRIHETFYLDHAHSKKSFSITRGYLITGTSVAGRPQQLCVDEVRGVLDFNVELYLNDTVKVTPYLRLYEGASCKTTDLDGKKPVFSQFIQLNHTSYPWRPKVTNTDENVRDDYMATDFVVRNRPEQPLS